MGFKPIDLLAVIVGVSNKSMFAEEIWQFVEGFVEVPANL